MRFVASARQWVNIYREPWSTSSALHLRGVSRAAFSSIRIVLRKVAGDNIEDTRLLATGEATGSIPKTKLVSRPGLATRRSGPWKPEEIDILRKLRAEQRSVRDMMDALPSRTEKSIRGQLAHVYAPIKSTSTSRTRWTKEEEDCLVSAKGQGMTFPEIARKLLPHRTEMTCAKKMASLRAKAGVPSPQTLSLFDENEDQMLKAMWAAGGTHYDIAEELNRSPHAIISRLRHFKLQRVSVVSDSRRRPWTAAELELAKNVMNRNMTHDERRTLFPGRNDNSVAVKLSQLRSAAGTNKFRRRSWTPAEEEQCIALYLARTRLEDIGHKLTRPEDSISSKLFDPVYGLVHRIRAAQQSQFDPEKPKAAIS